MHGVNFQCPLSIGCAPEKGGTRGPNCRPARWRCSGLQTRCVLRSKTPPSVVVEDATWPERSDRRMQNLDVGKKTGKKRGRSARRCRILQVVPSLLQLQSTWKGSLAHSSPSARRKPCRKTIRARGGAAGRSLAFCRVLPRRPWCSTCGKNKHET